MEEYISSVEEALTELTGESALGAQIASDVGDCFKLDLLQEIVAVEDVANAVKLMGRNVWDDERIVFAGVESLRRINFWRSVEQEIKPFMVKPVEYDALNVMLKCSMRHSGHRGIQIGVASFFQQVFRESTTQHIAVDSDQHAQCLAGALTNHPSDVNVQISAASALEVILRWEPDRRSSILGTIASHGCVPIFFDAIKNFCIALREFNQDAEDPVAQEGCLLNEAELADRASMFLLRMIADSRGLRFLIRYAIEHPSILVESVTSDLEGLELPNIDAVRQLVQNIDQTMEEFLRRFQLATIT